MYNGLMHLGFSNKDFLLADNSDDKGVYIAEWYSDKLQPSVEEIKTAQDEYDAEYASQNYARKRASEYPDYRDYLDAIVKGDDAQKQKYIDDCLAVKAKYPKPE